MDDELLEKLEKEAGIDIVYLDDGIYAIYLETYKDNVCGTLFFDDIFEQPPDLISLELEGKHICDFNVRCV